MKNNNKMNIADIVGMIRPIDKLGRVVLPKELRVQYEVNELDKVEIIGTKEGLLIRKYYANNICVFCRCETDNTYKGKCVCDDCITEITK